MESLSQHEDNKTENHILLNNDRLVNEENKVHQFCQYVQHNFIKFDLFQIYLLQQQNDLLDRIDTNTTKSIFCNLCGLDFSSKESFEEHYATHIVKCNICLVAFTSEEILDVHMKQSHSISESGPLESLPLEEIKVSVIQ